MRLDFQYWEQKRLEDLERRKEAIMSLHKDTFNYLRPSEAQVDDMGVLRQAFSSLAQAVDAMMPDGPDKTHVDRLIRTAAMWANVGITRQPDGTPRFDQS